MTASATPSHASALTHSAPEEPTSFIGRQAILDEHRNVFGYELFDRTTAAHAHTAASDAALLFNALSYTGTETLVGTKVVFINCTHESLRGGHLELIHPDRVVLEIPTLPPTASQEEVDALVGVLQELKDTGFRLAFDHNVLRRNYTAWLPLASFIKLDMLQVPLEHAPALIQFAHTYSRAKLVAEKVETQAQHERLQALGIKLFQGFWFAKPDVVPTKTIRPAQATILQLINLVRSNAEISDIEEVLKKDPTLSFNLLRFINSSGFGLSCEITSFRHAVMILGMKKLFRWAALLMTTARDDGAMPAVGHTAVVRGRLMELLASEMLSAEEAEHAFVVGVFSLLDVMLGMTLQQALDAVSLPQPVRDALLRQEGVFAPFLALTLACENTDDHAFATYAEALHLSNHQINWAHLQALIWADQLIDS